MSDPFKYEAHKLVDQLPEDASWRDLAERAAFLRKASATT